MKQYKHGQNRHKADLARQRGKTEKSKASEPLSPTQKAKGRRAKRKKAKKR